MYWSGRDHTRVEGFDDICPRGRTPADDAGVCGDYTYDVAYARAWQEAGCPEEDYAGPTDLPEGWEDPEFDSCPVESEDSE